MRELPSGPYSLWPPVFISLVTFECKLQNQSRIGVSVCSIHYKAPYKSDFAWSVAHAGD